jgi:hypothetical protein
MSDLSDSFAFLYTTDLDTLSRATREAARILAERKRMSQPESSAQPLATCPRKQDS